MNYTGLSHFVKLPLFWRIVFGERWCEVSSDALMCAVWMVYRWYFESTIVDNLFLELDLNGRIERADTPLYSLTKKA